MLLFREIGRLLRERREARRLRAQLRAVQDGRPHRHWSFRMLARVCRACRVRVI